jgi:hypothetical protein
MLGSFPSSSSSPASSPRATAVPIVSKKSDNITAKTGTITVQNPRVEKNPNEKFPRRLKSGVAVTGSGTLRDTGPDRVPDHVVAPDPVDDRRDHGGGHDPDKEAPLILRTTRIEQSARPIANVSVRRVVKSAVSPSGGLPGPWTTTPAFTSPMIIRNRAMPDGDRPLQVHRDRVQHGVAEPVRTRTVMRSPSTTIMPIASGQDRPWPTTSVNATKAFSPQTGGDRERVVRPQSHRDRREAGDESGDGEHGPERDPECSRSGIKAKPRICGFRNRM